MKRTTDDRAPRFSTYITSARGMDMIVVPKDSWEKMGDTGASALVDISRTPLSSVAQDSCFIAAEATRLSAVNGHVDVIRYDPKDAKDYNRDRYSVAENLPNHPDFDRMIDISDTDASPQLNEYLLNHVFLTKEEPDGAKWHWQDEDELSEPVRLEFHKKTRSQDK